MTKDVLVSGMTDLAEFELRRATGVKESWFRAWMKGAGEWPQSDTPGIDILGTAAVLQDPPARWPEFFDSELSTRQMVRVGAAMTGYHRRSGISTSDEAHARGQETPVSPTRFNTLWESARKTVGKRLTSVIGNGSFVGETKRNVDAIYIYFSDPRNSEKISRFTTSMRIAADILLSPEGHKLAEKYKEQYLGTNRDNVFKGVNFFRERELAVHRFIKASFEERGMSEEDFALMGLSAKPAEMPPMGI